MEVKKRPDVFVMKLRGRHDITTQPMSSSAGIQSLPQEMLLHIFSYLSLGELCNTVAKVCKLWERLHWDHAVYSVPKFLEGGSTTRKLLTCLKEAPCLESPYFDSTYIREIINKCLEVLNNKGELIITGEINFVKLHKDLVIMFSHLSNVVLKHMSANVDCKAVTHFLSGCVQLEVLKICRNDHNLLSNLELVALIDQLCGTLRVLHLDCELHWTLEDVKAISRCRLLEDLAILDAFGICSHSLLVIANMSSLRRLKIHRCFSPSADAWISMFSNDALKGLTYLHLRDCSYVDQVAITIGTHLKNLTELYMLKTITCHRCAKRYVGRKGLESIIKGCSKLTILEVGCGRDQPVEETIVLIPEYLPALKRLSIICYQVTKIKWETELKKKMPNLHISDR